MSGVDICTVKMLVWRRTWGHIYVWEASNVLVLSQGYIICIREASNMPVLRQAYTVCSAKHPPEFRHGASPQQDFTSTGHQVWTSARAHRMDARRPWWSDVSPPGWRRQLWVSVRVSHLCVCRGSENTYKDKNSKAQIFVEFQTSYKQLFNF